MLSVDTKEYKKKVEPSNIFGEFLSFFIIAALVSQVIRVAYQIQIDIFQYVTAIAIIFTAISLIFYRNKTNTTDTTEEKPFKWLFFLVPIAVFMSAKEINHALVFSIFSAVTYWLIIMAADND